MKNKLIFNITVAFLLIVASQTAYSASNDYENPEDLLSLDIEQLLDIEITTASYGPTTLREHPAIITIITREQIEQSGARDLIDIIQQVPGFKFAGEITEVIGLGTRGLWANEGKILLVIDDQKLNENLYGTLQFGNHFSADLIEQVEVIRGPGSAMYGGNAELAVIKVTTRGKGLNGGFLSTTLATNSGDLSHKYNLAVGHDFDDWGYSISSSFLEGSRSNETLKTLYGENYNMQGNADLFPCFLNIGANVKDLDIRYIKDDYSYEFRDYYGNKNMLRKEIFNSDLASIKYNWKINEKLTMIPEISYKKHEPWNQRELDTGQTYQSVETERFTYTLTNMYQFSEISLLTFGAEYYEDSGKAKPMTSWNYNQWFRGTDSRQKFYNSSYFAQYETETPLGNFTVGGRYEHHSFSGGSFVPRLGLTKLWDKFHIKALFSQAFRTPDIEVINSRFTTNMVAETTTTYEFETGYKFTDNIFWVGNVYYVRIDDPIFFYYDAVNDWGGYKNGSPVSSYGLETELHMWKNWGNIKLGYGYYRTDQNGISPWKSDDEHQALGFPAHQITFDTTYNITPQWSLNLNGFLTSNTRGYRYRRGQTVIDSYDPEVIANLFLQYKKDHLSVGVGISDLFNEKQLYPQAYDSYSGAIPAMSREFFMKVAYEF